MKWDMIGFEIRHQIHWDVTWKTAHVIRVWSLLSLSLASNSFYEKWCEVFLLWLQSLKNYSIVTLSTQTQSHTKKKRTAFDTIDDNNIKKENESTNNYFSINQKKNANQLCWDWEKKKELE